MTTAYLNLFECTHCGATNMTADDVRVQTFPGNREEPAEYEDRCPECHRTTIEEMTVHFCNGCDERMPAEDMTCVECQLENLETPDPGVAIDFAEYMMEDR